MAGVTAVGDVDMPAETVIEPVGGGFDHMVVATSLILPSSHCRVPAPVGFYHHRRD